MGAHHRIPWTDASDRKLVEMREVEKRTFKEIASMFGLKEHALHARYKKLRPNAAYGRLDKRGGWKIDTPRKKRTDSHPWTQNNGQHSWATDRKSVV